ncbi:MAG: phospholipase D family protein, partial [Kangiellaceae bacterium]|nr:phospholipase D family protein [Kangiellaceae bacterium]
MHLFKIIIVSLQLVILFGCSSLPDNSNNIKSYAISDTLNTTLGKHNEKLFIGLDTNTSALTLLEDGEDALVARIALARAAEKSLDLQYYHYHKDLTGQLLIYELWQAANRGVRVRLLLDDMGVETTDDNLAALANHPNFSIRIFNPFSRGKLRSLQYLSDFSRVTRRMHNKAFIADNQTAILGGRNIGDEYFGAHPYSIFGDLDIIISGNKPVRNVSKAFDDYWNSVYVYPAEILASKSPKISITKVSENLDRLHHNLAVHKFSKGLANTELAKSITNHRVTPIFGNVSVIYDSPVKIKASGKITDAHLISKLIPVFEKINKELIVVSPYFVPGKKGMDFFRLLRRKNVQVTILTNSLASQDVPIVFSAYSKYRKELLAIGVNIYELDPTTLGSIDNKKRRSMTSRRKKVGLHAKFLLVDKKQTFIGSMNFDPRSIY